MQIEWTQNAISDLAAIYEFIATDSPRYALSVVDRLTKRTTQRRLDCVLEPTKEKVLAKAAALKGGKVANAEPILNRVAKASFHNTSKLDFQKLKGDPDKIAANLTACGTGGMLAVADEFLHELNPDARLEMFGQDHNPESYAACGSDMLIKGHNIDDIVFGSNFTRDGFPRERFDYLLANPPFGVEWKPDQDAIQKEHQSLG